MSITKQLLGRWSHRRSLAALFLALLLIVALLAAVVGSGIARNQEPMLFSGGSSARAGPVHVMAGAQFAETRE